MSAVLDIRSARGQRTLADEMRVARYIEQQHGWRYATTDKDSPATVDAVLIAPGGGLAGVVETKCRYDVTEDEFVDRYRGQWLVTWDKVADGISIAKHLRVPFFGFLFLVKSGRLLTQRITDDNGLLMVTIRLETTDTQATCNGGTATRTNAFIDMTAARRFTLPERSAA